MEGVSFGNNPQPNEGFNIMGIDLGGGSQSTTGGFGGGDLLGFGNTQPTAVQPHTGGDLLGFGNSNPSSFGQGGQGGFSFDSPPSNPPPSQNFGFNLMGSNQGQSPPIIQTATTLQSQLSFVPIINNNPNKILAYENTHMQIWMDCIKESADTTKIFTTYLNKTNNTITEISIQAAVLKHIKLTINPLSSTTMQPYSKEVVHQNLTVVNSMAGQKGVVMKMKLSYAIGGQKYNFEEKIANFPAQV